MTLTKQPPMTMLVDEKDRDEIIKTRTPSNGWFSASSLSTLMQCPMKYRLKYVDMIEEKQTMSLVQGVAFHAAMQKMVEKKWDDMDMKYAEMCGRISVDVIDQKRNDINFFTDCVDEIEQDVMDAKAMNYSLLYNIVNHKELMPHPERTNTDRPFTEMYFSRKYTYTMDGKPDLSFFIHGFIDMISVDGRIIDWKTASQRWSERKELYELQTPLYLSAIDRDYIEYFIFLKHKKQEKRSIDIRRVGLKNFNMTFFEEIELPSLVRTAQSNEYLPRPSETSCRYCQSKKECPMFKVVF